MLVLAKPTFDKIKWTKKKMDSIKRVQVMSSRLNRYDHMHDLLRRRCLRLVRVQHSGARVMRRAAEVRHRGLGRHAGPARHRAERRIGVEVGRRTTVLLMRRRGTRANKSDPWAADRRQSRGSGRRHCGRSRCSRAERRQALHRRARERLAGLAPREPALLLARRDRV